MYKIEIKELNGLGKWMFLQDPNGNNLEGRLYHDINSLYDFGKEVAVNMNVTIITEEQNKRKYVNN